MTVKPIGGIPPERPESRPVAEKANKAASQGPDRVELSPSGGAQTKATYTRSGVVSATAATQPAEVPMAQDARAQKLASIRQRMEAGVYNTREVVEQVVDRLLDRWNLNPSGGTTRPSS